MFRDTIRRERKKKDALVSIVCVKKNFFLSRCTRCGRWSSILFRTRTRINFCTRSHPALYSTRMLLVDSQFMAADCVVFFSPDVMKIGQTRVVDHVRPYHRDTISAGIAAFFSFFFFFSSRRFCSFSFRVRSAMHTFADAFYVCTSIVRTSSSRLFFSTACPRRSAAR